MAAMKSLLGTTALLLFLMIANFHQTEAQCGGFQDSCKDYAIAADGVFSAQCRRGRGPYVGASIDLNKYISNANGRLADGAGFAASCNGEELLKMKVPIVAFYLIADCRKADGEPPQFSKYDIGYHLANTNGVLTWRHC